MIRSSQSPGASTSAGVGRVWGADHKRASDKVAMAGGKIVVRDRMVAGRHQRAAAMRADIARAAGNQDGRAIAHISPVASDRCWRTGSC